MMKRNVISKTLVGTVLLASLALAGCGSTPTQVEDPFLEDPAMSDPYGNGGSSYTDPSMGGGTGAYPGGSTGGMPVTGIGGELSASVIKVKNGSFMGIGKCVVTVEVMNPSQSQLTGTLTVTFTNKGKPTKNVQTKSVSLAGGESTTFEFEDKKWSTDNATAEITTDASASTMPATGGAYGTQPAYGQSQAGYGTTY